VRALWRLRDYDDDLAQAIQVWHQSRTAGSAEAEFAVGSGTTAGVRRGAETAFHREMEYGWGEPATTEDYLLAIGDVRPILTAAILAQFTEDKAQFAGLWFL
jgi:hypothetical protein